MSAPQQLPQRDPDRRKSLGRYVKRMSSVFKRDKHDKHATAAEPTSQHAPAPVSASASAPTPASASASAPAPASPPAREVPDVAPNVASQQEHVSQTTPDPAVASTTAESAAPDATKEDAGQAEIAKWRAYRAEIARKEAASAAPAATDNLTPVSTVQPPAPISMTAVDRNAMQQERARALFAKYGLSLDSHEWIATSAPAPLVPRVEKAVRMRVHRSCHRCGTFYGSEKVCQQCEHKRCKKCPRFPKKKSSDKGKEAEADEKPRKKRVLTVTTRSGNELAYQPTKQRIKRACHKCDAPFIPPTATVCGECRHARCTKCPRDPPKRSKWADGYPGDVEPNSDSEAEKQRDEFRRIWRKPRRIVRWECELCNTMFRNGSPMCPGCGHERCDQCTRSPVKKPSTEEMFDPEVVAAVEAKLRALGVDDDSPTTEPAAT